MRENLNKSESRNLLISVLNSKDTHQLKRLFETQIKLNNLAQERILSFIYEYFTKSNKVPSCVAIGTHFKENKEIMDEIDCILYTPKGNRRSTFNDLKMVLDVIIRDKFKLNLNEITKYQNELIRKKNNLLGDLRDVQYLLDESDAEISSLLSKNLESEEIYNSII